MLHAGTTLHIRLTSGDSHTTSTGKTIRHYLWSAHDATGDQILQATAVMLRA
ncbi:hypothetical protein [Spongiactinospora sp. TRM90649]|uniref:hypothetical protein n=1 Tax=Spongiactinospora sp. TRM90649 TaxID=3031114 RepID=UPI0023F8F104|nr:hypothetical protein [Spongiactinospora sp. TRM90649]MDF5753097.1 hypothetical protein [Spongiactinospora sp. TRM90649]